MKYAFFLYAAEGPESFDNSPEAMEAWAAFDEAAEQTGTIAGGEALEPVATAKTVRVRGGRPEVTDGPFAETREQLGGFYIIDVPDLDAALELAAKIPVQEWGSVEVRPVLDVGDGE